MRVLRAYVDTSVFGGTEDVEFSDASRRFFDLVRGGRFVVLLSTVTVAELEGAPPKVKQVLQAVPAEHLEKVEVSDEAKRLAQAYVDAGVLGKGSIDDATHVAVATVAKADLILSWNFRHIVNVGRIHQFNGVNMVRGYGQIEIRSPLEVVYDDQD